MLLRRGHQGPWSAAEVALLTKLVEDQLKGKRGKAVKPGTKDDNKGNIDGVEWVRVSREMGNKRTVNQCLKKWYDQIRKDSGERRFCLEAR